MSNPSELFPDEQAKRTQANSRDRNSNASDRTVDPRDLVRTGGYPQDIWEAVESPMVTPEMLNEPGDLRGDTLEEDWDIVVDLPPVTDASHLLSL